MDKKQEFWNVFTETGRVEDYLRYRFCEEDKEEMPREIPDGRRDHPRDAGRGSG